MFTAVRHTPFTEMLAPSFMSSRTRRHWMRIRDPAAATVPTSSMMPVNKLLHHVSFHREFVGWDGMEPHAIELDGVGAAQPAGAAGHRERLQAAQNFRRVIKENLVDD